MTTPRWQTRPASMTASRSARSIRPRSLRRCKVVRGVADSGRSRLMGLPYLGRSAWPGPERTGPSVPAAADKGSLRQRRQWPGQMRCVLAEEISVPGGVHRVHGVPGVDDPPRLQAWMTSAGLDLGELRGVTL